MQVGLLKLIVGLVVGGWGVRDKREIKIHVYAKRQT